MMFVDLPIDGMFMFYRRWMMLRVVSFCAGGMCGVVWGDVVSMCVFVEEEEEEERERERERGR